MVFNPTTLVDQSKITKIIESMSPIISEALPIFSRTSNHPESIIGVDTISSIAKSVALSAKGSIPETIGNETRNVKLIEPEPIYVAETVSPAEILKLQAYTGDMLDSWLARRIEAIRRAIMNTKNTLAATSITGTCSWVKKNQNGLQLPYTIEFGTPATVTVSGAWANASTKLATIANDVKAFVDAMIEAGYNGDLAFYCGKTTFSALAEKLNATTNSAVVQARVTPMMIEAWGLKFYNTAFKHYNSSGTFTSAVGDTEIYCIDLAAGHETVNMPIYDFNQGLRPVPMLIETKMGSGLDQNMYIVGKATPLFIPVVDAIKKATCGNS